MVAVFSCLDHVVVMYCCGDASELYVDPPLLCEDVHNRLATRAVHELPSLRTFSLGIGNRGGHELIDNKSFNPLGTVEVVAFEVMVF